MQKPGTHNHPQTVNAFRLRTPLLPQLPENIRRLLDAAYIEHGGAERMRLGEWLAVEEELKQKLESEYHEHQP
jgi:hypothetical protein